ncbi:hypothetical protein [Embleya sp. AB8]|uniref:hypothetical protein n=1 Tax=Embleya sp. AB8 TaxID=3156304 RepID=UPI003C7620AC
MHTFAAGERIFRAAGRIVESSMDTLVDIPSGRRQSPIQGIVQDRLKDMRTPVGQAGSTMRTVVEARCVAMEPIVKLILRDPESTCPDITQ